MLPRSTADLGPGFALLSYRLHSTGAGSGSGRSAEVLVDEPGTMEGCRRRRKPS